MAAAEDDVPATRPWVIVQTFVVEEQTKRVVYEAARISSCTRLGPDGHREYTEIDNGFHVLLGSVLGSGKEFSLHFPPARISVNIAQLIYITTGAG